AARAARRIPGDSGREAAAARDHGLPRAARRDPDDPAPHGPPLGAEPLGPGPVERRSALLGSLPAHRPGRRAGVPGPEPGASRASRAERSGLAAVAIVRVFGQRGFGDRPPLPEDPWEVPG